MTIPDNTTIEAIDFWKGLIAGTAHPLPCQCDFCLYSLYRKRIKKKGRPFGRLMFFVNWLIHRVKMEYLIKNNKAQRIQTYEGSRWQVKIKSYDTVPYLKKVSKIIGELEDEYSIKDISADLNFYLYVYKSRTEQHKFIRLVDELAEERRLEWLRTQPDIVKEWKENQHNAHFCQRIVDFIRSRPGKKATLRDLERHFSNKRKADLERAFEWLFFYPNIKRRKKGKSLIFYWTRPTKAEIEVYNQRVAEEIRSAWAEHSQNH